MMVFDPSGEGDGSEAATLVRTNAAATIGFIISYSFVYEIAVPMRIKYCANDRAPVANSPPDINTIRPIRIKASEISAIISLVKGTPERTACNVS